MLKNYPGLGNEKSHPSRKNFAPEIARDFTRHSTAKVLELERPGKFVVANLPIDPHAIPRCRSLNRRDAHCVNKRAAQPLKCATAAGSVGNQFWAISVAGTARNLRVPSKA